MDCAGQPGTWVCAKGDKAGENQAVGREGLRPSDDSPCCSAHPGSSWHVLLHDRDSAGPAGRGSYWAEPGGELSTRPSWSDIVSHLSQMPVLLLCICFEATVRET